MSSLVITLDGPAASGKGTLARALGHRFNLAVLDTGLLYRLVGLACHRAGVDPHDAVAATRIAEQMAARLTLAQLDHRDLRGVEASRAASVYSAIPGVRSALTAFQRDFAASPPAFLDGHPASGAILDGRDCGTVICPAAPLKFYIIADVSERAHRRLRDLESRGITADYESVLNDLMVRDHRDMTRAVAPTVAADDAITMDTTGRSVDALVDELGAYVEAKLHLARDASSGTITPHDTVRE